MGVHWFDNNAETVWIRSSVFMVISKVVPGSVFPLSMALKMELIQDRAIKNSEQRWMTPLRIWITQTERYGGGFVKRQDILSVEGKDSSSTPFFFRRCSFDRLVLRNWFLFPHLPVPILCCWQTVSDGSLTKMSTFKSHVHQAGWKVHSKFSISCFKVSFNSYNSSQWIVNLICHFSTHGYKSELLLEFAY